MHINIYMRVNMRGVEWERRFVHAFFFACRCICACLYQLRPYFKAACCSSTWRFNPSSMDSCSPSPAVTLGLASDSGGGGGGGKDFASRRKYFVNILTCCSNSSATICKKVRLPSSLPYQNRGLGQDLLSCTTLRLLSERLANRYD